jgi:hypothetical protein
MKMSKLIVENYGPSNEPTIPHNYPKRIVPRKELTDDEKSQSYEFEGVSYSVFEKITLQEHRDRMADPRLADCIYFAVKKVGDNNSGKPADFVQESKSLGAHLNRPQLSENDLSDGFTEVMTAGEIEANRALYKSDFENSAGIKKLNARKQMKRACNAVDQWEFAEFSKGYLHASGFVFPITKDALGYFTTLFSIKNNIRAEFFPLKIPNIDGDRLFNVANSTELDALYNLLAVAHLTIKSTATQKKHAILKSDTVDEIETILLSL